MMKLRTARKVLAQALLIAALAGVALMETAHAQFDDLEDTFNPPGDFPPPPPPPSGNTVPPPPPPSVSGRSNTVTPPNRGSARPSAPAASESHAAGDGGSGVLSTSQKEKFARAGLEDITNENFPETIESFDFPNAEVQDIVKAISELTGRNFIVDPDVRGKITIMAPSKITVAEAYKAFLSALAIRGYTLVPSGGFWKIRNSRSAQKDGIELYSGDYYPNTDQLITRVIQFKHISAELMEKNLRNLISRDGDFFVYASTNSIILSDYGSNVERVVKIFSQMDVPGFEDQMELITIRHAKAKDLAELLNKILNKGETPQGRGGAGGSFGSGVPRFNRPTSSPGSQSQAYFVVIPDERTNSLVVVGNKAGIARIKRLVAQLDFRMNPEDSGGVFVYYVKHGDAEKIAQTLTGVAKEAAPQRPGAGGGGLGGIPFVSPTTGKTTSTEIFGGDVKITANKETNSLVIVASKQDYEVVLSLLDKIDIQRDQVFVETVIMEMNANSNTDWQIGFFKFNSSGRLAGFGDSKKGSSLLSPLGPPAGLLGFGSSDMVKITTPGTTGTASSLEVPSLLGFINFLKTHTNANILSTPQVVALDNQEAEIEVGDRVVTSVTNTPATATTPATQSPNFEDATIKLTLTPNISPQQNSVRLAVNASVKQPLASPKAPETLQNSTLTLATRRVKTNIVVPNGDTAVIGGLMKDSDTVQQTKVPLLGDIPVLGWLFKTSQTTKEKVNMLIFLTPKIIRTDSDRSELLGKKMDERIKHVKATGGVDPYGEKMDELSKKAAAPGAGNPVPR